MPMLLRKLLAPYMNEATDGTEGGAGGAMDTSSSEGTTGDSGASTEGAAGASVDNPVGESSQEPKETMLEAVSKALDKSGEKKPEEKPAGEQAPADGKKTEAKAQPNGEEALQMPEGLSAKAQQRFQSLVTRVKEAESKIAETNQKYEQAHQYASSVSSMLRDAGASPQQLHEALGYIKALNGGDLNTRRNLLLAELRDVSMQLGEPVQNFIDGADPLTEFPDLKQAVDSYQITREHALELARGRAAENVRRSQHEEEMRRAEQRNSGVQAWIREKDEALGQIDKITRDLAASDPLFPLIQSQLMANEGGLKEIVEKFPPSTWVSQVNLLISTARTAIQKFKPAGGAGGPRPLSGGGGKPSGSSAVPNTMYDAMFPSR